MLRRAVLSISKVLEGNSNPPQAISADLFQTCHAEPVGLVNHNALRGI
jgi:hypothetical protein